MKSPFKFLDAYTIEDREVFLGRDEESAALYDMVRQNRLILIYGQSGAGKTSLVQCGLASHFDATDWYPLFIRRQDDLNQSLEQRLALAAGLQTVESTPGVLESLYETYLRPVYLIFDQLEELFILGTPDEQNRFIRTIRSVLETRVPVRILFIIREEYLAHLYGFERIIPTLFDRRLRVESMSVAKVQQVLEGSFKRFNIAVEAPAEKTRQLIIDQVSGGRAGIQLPYLQVYLDWLYRDDYARTYPGREPEPGKWLPLEFSQKEIKTLGKIEDVLEKFLFEQIAIIQRRLQSEFQPVDESAVKNVLDAFVSEEGTKRPIGFERQGENLVLEARWSNLFAPLPAPVVDRCCRLLEQSRLLRFTDRHIELAHDALAQLIDGQRTRAQRRMNESYNRLMANFREYADTGELLSRKQLNLLEEFLPVFEARLDPGARQFVADSYVRADEADRAELMAERRQRRQARRIAAAGFTLSAIALIAFGIAFFQYRAAESAKEAIARNAFTAQRNTAETLKVEGKYAEALQQLQSLAPFADALGPGEQRELETLSAQWLAVKDHMLAGDSLAQSDDLLAALERYRQARAISPDARIDNLIRRTESDVEGKFQQYRLYGEALYNAKKYAAAAENYEKALKLRPDDAAVKARLQQCRAQLE